jgi:hypothetical protein
VEEITDEPLYRDRVCGTGIGKAGMAATIRVPSEKNPARRAQETRLFPTTKRGVLELADWMRAWQVPAAVMEATSVIWGRRGTVCHGRRQPALSVPSSLADGLSAGPSVTQTADRRAHLATTPLRCRF